MKKNIVFLLILIPIIWISCDGMGHQTIDFRKIENLMPQHPDSALMLLEQIENKENLSRKDKAHYYLLLTEAQDKTFVKHETDSLITIVTDYYEETDDLERKAKAWFYKGRINQDLNQPLKAQEYYLKALREEEQIKDYALLGRINNNIGMLYTYQTVYDKALPFQKKAVEDFRMLKDSMGQVFALRDLGRTFLMLGYQDSAIICNQKAIALMGKNILPSVYTELASLYMRDKRQEEAYELLQTSLQNITKPRAKYPAYLVLGQLYKERGQIDSARFYLQACVDSAPLPTTHSGGLFYLREIALEQGQWEQAALLSKRYELSITRIAWIITPLVPIDLAPMLFLADRKALRYVWLVMERNPRTPVNRSGRNLFDLFPYIIDLTLNMRDIWPVALLCSVKMFVVIHRPLPVVYLSYIERPIPYKRKEGCSFPLRRSLFGYR